MSIINGAVVYRVAGDTEMGGQMVNSLIYQDNMRLRQLLLDTTNTLNVYRSVRSCEADRKLARIADMLAEPGSLWYRMCKQAALCLLIVSVLLDRICSK